MIVKKDFLEKLKAHFNLNIYEVKIWTALLSRGVASAGELSDIGEVPRSRSYDVLESLEKKGFVIMKLGKPIKYIAVQPEEILSRMRTNVEEESEHQLTKLESIKETELFKEIELLYKQGIDHIEPTDLSGAIVGRTNIYNHIKSMVENAQKDVTIVTTSEGFVRKAKALKNSFRRSKSKGVSIKIMAPLSSKHQEDIKKIGGSAEVKSHDNINARFVIVDGKEMLFMMAEDNKDLHPTYDTAVWVRSPFFTQAFSALVNSAWKSNK